MPVMPGLQSTARASTRRGYTLLELTISMPLLAILMLGMASAISISSRSVPDSRTVPSAIVAVTGKLNQMADELNYATAISARASSDITFVTPDRNGNGSADTIRYRWSGIVGDPLLRSYQGSTDEIVLPTVQQFTLTYDAPVDAESGLPLLRSIQLELRAPAGSTSGISMTIGTLNRPQLP